MRFSERTAKVFGENAGGLMFFVRRQDPADICQANSFYSMPAMTGKWKITLTAAVAVIAAGAAAFPFLSRTPARAENSPGIQPTEQTSRQPSPPEPADPPALSPITSTRAASPATAPTMMYDKVGVVDMSRVFQGYYKTRQLERKLNEDRSKAKKEMDTRTEKYRSLSNRLAEIDKVLKDRLVNEQLKQQKHREGQSLMEEANRMAREIQEFASRRERQLQDVADRMKREVVKEIVAQVRETSKRDNFDFVFDRSGLAIGGTPLLPVSREAADISSAVIAELNRHAPPADANADAGATSEPNSPLSQPASPDSASPAEAAR